VSDDRAVPDEPPGREPAGGLTDRARAFVGALICALYAIGMSLRGEVLAGVVGGILAAILCFLVLREVERQRRERRR
jgi:hypothetical protein